MMRDAVGNRDSTRARRSPWRLIWQLATRYLGGGRSGLLSGTAAAALGSTCLGVTAMVVAMALLSGYTRELQDKILTSGSLIVYPPATWRPEAVDLEGADLARMLARLRSVDGVASVSRAAFLQGSLSSPERPTGLDVFVRGVEPGSGPLGATRDELSGVDGVTGAVLGAELADRLGLSEGDLCRLVAIGVVGGTPKFGYRSLRVSGTFRTGFSEFDRSYLLLDRGVVDDLGAGPGLLEVSTEADADIDRVRADLESELGEHYLVADWTQSNPDLFAALRLQKFALFFVLGLIVVVSTFNVGSTLVVLVRDRMTDIGVLCAMGLRPRDLRRVFVVCGGILGLVGITAGLAVGSAINWILTTFRLIRFAPEVAEIYFIEFVPFDTRLLDLGSVGLFSILVILLAAWFPARRLAAIDPASALRWE